MKQFNLLGIITFTVFFCLFFKPVHAANIHKYAICDKCGLCVDVLDDTKTTSPKIQIRMKGYTETWPSCMKCLYPDIVTNDSNKLHGDYESLRLLPDPKNPDHTIPYPTKPGRFYTGLGCLTTNLNDFTEPGAAASLATPLLNIVSSVGGAIAFLYLLYGAFLIVTSGGNSQQITSGKQTISGSIIGIIFALSAVFLINLIGKEILRIPGF